MNLSHHPTPSSRNQIASETRIRQPKTLIIILLAAGFWQAGCADNGDKESASTNRAMKVSGAAKTVPTPDTTGVFHIREGDSIQEVLDAAAIDRNHKRVVIHEGTYRPPYPSQAMVKFHARHDGIILEGSGLVTLTAENRDVAIPGDVGFPAIVNHVVYFGDGVSSATRLKGIRITGANGFATKSETDGPIEPHSNQPGLEKKLFFYLDGGAIKVFGKSSPTIESVEVIDNQTQLCGGGISIEQRGFRQKPVRIVDCKFMNNKCPATGSAIDVLEGSTAIIQNCLFVGNIANYGMEEVRSKYGLEYNPEHGCGALTVFPNSAATVNHCTFTQNWNGADDQGESSYADCIFWMNTASTGELPGSSYELDITKSASVVNCWFHGEIDDLRGTIDPAKNTFRAPDPQFDTNFEPLNPDFRNAGYRVNAPNTPPDPDSATAKTAATVK